MDRRATILARVSARFPKSVGETPVSSEPGESALHHLAARQDDEAPHVELVRPHGGELALVSSTASTRAGPSSA
jgi:hypothetical protein